MQSEFINELASALSKAQAMMKRARKSGVNTYFKKQDGTFHHFSTLSDIWEVVREPFSENGLSVSQTFQKEGILETTLLHASGQWIRGEFQLLVQKNDMQSMASAASYAKRYALSAISGVSDTDEDDDANQASGKDESVKAPSKDIPRGNDFIHPHVAEVRCGPRQAEMLRKKFSARGYVGADMQNALSKYNLSYRFPEEVFEKDVDLLLAHIDTLAMIAAKPAWSAKPNPKVPPPKEEEPPFDPDIGWTQPRKKP